MHKWRQFKYSFVYIHISSTSLILGNIFFWKFNPIPPELFEGGSAWGGGGGGSARGL